MHYVQNDQDAVTINFRKQITPCLDNENTQDLLPPKTFSNINKQNGLTEEELNTSIHNTH